MLLPFFANTGSRTTTSTETISLQASSVPLDVRSESSGIAIISSAIPDYATVASALGINEATLLKDFHAGESIADVAQQQGISEQSLIGKIEASLKVQLDEQVKDGKLTSAQEQQALNGFASQAKRYVEQVPQFITATSQTSGTRGGRATTTAPGPSSDVPMSLVNGVGK